MILQIVEAKHVAEERAHNDGAEEESTEVTHEVKCRVALVLNVDDLWIDVKPYALPECVFFFFDASDLARIRY